MSRYKGHPRASRIGKKGRGRKDSPTAALLTGDVGAIDFAVYTFHHHTIGEPAWQAMPRDEETNSNVWKEITLNYLGNRVRGSYKVVGRLVVVVSGPDSKTANLGILPAERLAHMLLRQMAFEKRHNSPFIAMTRLLNDR